MDRQIKVFNLMCRVVEERHVAKNIRKWIGDAQQEFSIKDNQLLTFTIDSGSNVTKAIDDYIAKIAKGKSGSSDSEDEGSSDSSDDEDEVDSSINSDRELFEKIDEDDENVEPIEFEEPEQSEFDIVLAAIRIHCAVHKLQLGVNDFLKDRKFQRAIAIAQKLTAKLRTPTARLLLKREKTQDSQDVSKDKVEFDVRHGHESSRAGKLLQEPRKNLER